MLHLTSQAHSWGVLLDSALLSETEMLSVDKSAFYQSQQRPQLRPFLENGDLTAVTHALTTSRPGHCQVSL